MGNSPLTQKDAPEAAASLLGEGIITDEDYNSLSERLKRVNFPSLGDTTTGMTHLFPLIHPIVDYDQWNDTMFTKEGMESVL